jgi:nicotinamidase-related amidase
MRDADTDPKAAVTRSANANILAVAVPPVSLARDGSTALVVIDMQYHDAAADHGYNLALQRIQPGSAEYFIGRIGEVVVPTIRRLLDYFRGQRLPVIHVVIGSDYRDYRDIPARTREWTRYFEKHGAVEDILWSENPSFSILHELSPTGDETVIRKRTFSAFNSSNIDQVLRELGVRSLVITGVVTSGCVEATARDAGDLGYGCVVVDTGTADYDPELHASSLRAFRLSYGSVMDGPDDVIAALESSPTGSRQCG